MVKRGVGILFFGLVFIVLVFTIFGVIAQDANQETGNSQSTSEEASGARDVGGGEETRTDDAAEQEAGEAGDLEDGESEAEDVGATRGTEETGENAKDGLDDISEEEVNKELVAGSKPGDTLYFVDKFLDNLFGNCLDIRKERAAEIRELAREGKIKEARQSLDGYQECAEEVEREVSPGEREEAVRSAKLIRKAIRDVEDDIPEGDRKELVDDIIDKEKNIERAAEIASKIKDLCVQLSKLDPGEYSRVCKTKDDAPRWQRELDDDLTEEQKVAARKFASVMQECFKSQGRECKCNELDDINKPFADRCAVVAPLAAKCKEGDEGACEAMDEATEGIEELLPDYLRDVMADLEGGVKEDQFDMHMPRECVEEGARDPKRCIEIMFRRNAPGPCLNALDRGEISFTNEREAREACEKIMFEDSAPPECVERGLRNPRDCGKLMFELNAPPECTEAGLTGENRDDPRKCEKLMREKFGEGPEGSGGRRGPGGPGPDCRRIENPEERLKCYDGALADAGERGRGEGGPHGGWPPPCEEAQAFTRESCEKIMREWGEKQRSEDEERFRREREEREGEFRERGEEERRRFEEDRRRREEEFRGREGEFRPPEGQFGPPEGFRPPEGFVPPEGFRPPEGQPPPTTQPPTGEQSPSGEQQTTTESSGTGGGESGGTTGSVISIDNAIFDYYYRR